MSPRSRLCRVGLVIALVFVSMFGAGTALAVPSGSVTSGPLTLMVPNAPYFVKGVQERLYNYHCGAQKFESGDVRQLLSATSPYGIESWDVAAYDDGPGWTPWRHYSQSKPPIIAYRMINYASDCGGQYDPCCGDYVMKVTDKQGNVAELEELSAFAFERWDNTMLFRVVGGIGSFNYDSAWAPYRNCSQCDNGSTAYTTKPGGSAVFYLPSSANSSGAHLGLVMTEGPGHGAVKLYLDGALEATVDTNSPTWKYRTYVYDFGPLTSGAHTVKLVNVGTHGRPRIDVQGVGLVTGQTDIPSCDPTTCP